MKLRTRGTISGWESAATISASARTRARPRGSFGRIGGFGCVSSRYSMMATDWNRIGPSPSISAGSSICGLTFLVRVLPLLALHQVDVDDLVRHDALDVERDAHAECRERTPEGIEFHVPPP